jgi:hypothetical protein
MKASSWLNGAANSESKNESWSASLHAEVSQLSADLCGMENLDGQSWRG